MCFKQLMGFDEISHVNVHKNISVEGALMISLVNGNRYRCGFLEVPALKDLRNGTYPENYRENIKISEAVGNVAWLHKDEENNNAVFQAASQFTFWKWFTLTLPPKAVWIFMKMTARRGQHVR